MKMLPISLIAFWPSFLLAQPNGVDESKYISVGGIEQWITIKGEDITKPIILFLHGGPGSVMSAYDNKAFAGWETDFILVNWDQRGAGRTFGRNAPKEVDEEYWLQNPLTVEQMVADGIAVSEYLTSAFGKKKIILMATSWGSVLGVTMALSRPDLFYVYLSHSQIVTPLRSQLDAYNYVKRISRRSNDHESHEKLMAMGPPPYSDARNTGQLLRLIKKYERANEVKAPESWWIPAKDYDNEIDARNRADGDDYSFIHYVGHEKLGIQGMMKDVDFMMGNLNFRIPIYFFQGENDILTRKGATKKYFTKIQAPTKKFILIHGAAHGYNRSVVRTQHDVLMKHVLPLINNN